MYLFRVNQFHVLTILIYVVPFTTVVPMPIIEVSFSKWSHLAYRHFALYLLEVVDSVITTEKAKDYRKTFGLNVID